MFKSGKPVFVERGSLAIGLLVKDFKNNTFLDVRNYYDADGEWKPTAKGLMIPIEHSREVLRAMEDLIDPIAPKQSMPKTPKTAAKPKVEKIKLWLVSHRKPEFKDGEIQMAQSRVRKSRDDAIKKAGRKTDEGSLNRTYKVFEYHGSKPRLVEDGDFRTVVFDKAAGGCRITLVYG